jgi:hypothetical protein
LQERIKSIRAETNNPSPLSVQLKDVPLRGLIKNYQYESVGDKWKDVKTSISLQVSVDFIAGNPVDLVLKSFPLLAEFQSYFTSPRLMIENATYVLVQQNDGCSYTGKVADLYGSASRAGSTILAIQSKQAFIDYNIFEFEPILCFMVPYTTTYRNGNTKAKFGFLIGFPPSFLSIYDIGPDSIIYQTIQENSELLFIPIQSDLEIIENADIPKGNGLSFPLTNGGNFDVNISSYVQQYNNASKSVLASIAQAAALRASQAAAQAAAAQAAAAQALQLALTQAAKAVADATNAAEKAVFLVSTASSSLQTALTRNSDIDTYRLNLNSNYSLLLTFTTKAAALSTYNNILQLASLITTAVAEIQQASFLISNVILSEILKWFNVAMTASNTVSILLVKYPIVQPSMDIISAKKALVEASYYQTLNFRSQVRSVETQAISKRTNANNKTAQAQAFYDSLPP